MRWRAVGTLVGSGLATVALVLAGPAAGAAAVLAPALAPAPPLASALAPAAPVPPDITAYLAGPALAQVADAVRGTRAGGPVPSEAATIGAAYRLHVFTPAFLDGATDATPVEPTDEWVAPLVDAGRPVMTVRVRKPDGGPAEFAGVDGSADAATGLTAPALRTATDGRLVEDPTIGALYLLERGVLTPLDHPAFPDIDNPTTLSKAQPVIAARIATFRSLEAAQDRSARLRLWVPIGAAAVIAVGAVALGVFTRRRPADAAPSA